MATEIHPTAVVDPSVKLGVDVRIGPYVVVEADTVIGDGSYVESFAVIKRYTEMGKNNHIHPNAVIGGEPQHVAYQDEKTFTRLGDNNTVRECVTIHRGTVQGDGETVVGSNCMLMAYSHVAHDCRLGDNVILANSVNLAGHVQIGNHVIVSGISAVQQHVRIGDYAFLGGASGYNLDVPPYMLAHGVRGKLSGLNIIGLKRHGFTSETCKMLKRAYKTIFCSGQTKEKALAQVEAEIQGVPEVDTLVAFIRESRGVAPDTRQKSGQCQDDE
ncbi:acyl-ACP--UDP-N-acetylglucosamine O-acyltransferase [Pseudodesulfovibrio tunisiensis]|uniref:acyl-ACP--UDP-N-acetylglucosamine O-acyltransferase n=1 Tax=Pseudodesulfovibrio tunisiensis TaxID=463192 RepID=UPI001FB36D93|nr:acyl-ACP--UDP-N-acetylglucosamine O-acyltransferase [Pseudodesulfovibrio tunisiensis]